MNTISPLQSVPVLGKSGSQTGRPAQQQPLPEPGQLLKATVIETRPDNRILLQIGDNRLVARSEIPLQPGQTLQLQLVSTSPQLELKVVNDTLQQFFGRSLTLVGNTLDISTLFSSLQQPASLLDSLSLSSKQALENFFSLQPSSLSEDGGGAALKQLVDRIGLSLEKFLARGESGRASTTLKAALLEVLNSFKSNSQISDSAGKTLATLEFFQLVQLHADSGQQLIFPLPLSFIEQGFLLIERRQDEEGGGGEYSGQEYRFSLHLKMSDIGNLRIDFFHSPEGLFIRFHADSQEKADFIAEAGEELRKAISETPILGISFAADAEDPATELIRHIVPEGRPVLDTTA